MSLDITVTDMFCGAGGSSTGAVRAGATVKLAMNHWARAVETHNTNHPNTDHALADISQANPRHYPRSNILIASPECTNQSNANGKEKPQRQLALWNTTQKPNPAEERSRCTMWDPLRFAEVHGYEMVILENVVEARKWVMWDAWIHGWKSLNYEYEIVYLNSMFAHPTPQSRDRMYFVAWKRRNRKPDLAIRPAAHCQKCARDVEAVQCWKNAGKRAGKYKQQYIYCCPVCAYELLPYFYAAASAIDWTRPTQRISERKTPLKEKTMERIAYGLEKFAGHPFSIPMTRVQDRLRDMVQDPFPTQTATETQGLVLTLSHNGDHASCVYPTDQRPLPTQTIRDDLALVTSPFLIDHVAEYRPRSLNRPISTIVGGGNHQSLVIPPAWLMSYYNNGAFEPVSAPIPTVTTLDRCALVTRNEMPRAEDCGFRMLEPHEIQAAMAFPQEYIITGTRREKVKQLGNAVTPPVMELLMRRCLASLAERM